MAVKFHGPKSRDCRIFIFPRPPSLPLTFRLDSSLTVIPQIDSPSESHAVLDHLSFLFQVVSFPLIFPFTAYVCSNFPFSLPYLLVPILSMIRSFLESLISLTHRSLWLFFLRVPADRFHLFQAKICPVLFFWCGCLSFVFLFLEDAYEGSLKEEPHPSFQLESPRLGFFLLNSDCAPFPLFHPFFSLSFRRTFFFS